MTDEQFDKLCGKLDKFNEELVDLKKVFVAGMLTNAGLNKAGLGRTEPVSDAELNKAFNEGNVIFNNYYNAIKEVKRS